MFFNFKKNTNSEKSHIKYITSRRLKKLLQTSVQILRKTNPKKKLSNLQKRDPWLVLVQPCDFAD